MQAPVSEGSLAVVAPVSEARLIANRANAQKSTGPRTQAGKDISRLNAFQHGMAGHGDLLGPGEDAAAIAALAAEFERDYHAQGRSGQMLAHRAALLSVRMDRLAQRQLEVEKINVAAAIDGFDTDRNDWLDEEFRRFEAGGDEGREALEILELTPEGVLRLLDLGDRVWPDLTSSDPTIVQAATERARRWLLLKGGQGEGAVIERFRAELIRVEAVFETMGERIETLASDRNRVGRLARFDDSPGAALAQRYEAAAERGMHKALRAIVAQNRERTRDRQQDAEHVGDQDRVAMRVAARQLRAVGAAPQPVAPTALSTPEPAPERSSEPWVKSQAPPSPPAALGSFRAGTGNRVVRLAAELFGADDLDPAALHGLQSRSELPLTASRR